jgi:hypothetical protein
MPDENACLRSLLFPTIPLSTLPFSVLLLCRRPLMAMHEGLYVYCHCENILLTI